MDFERRFGFWRGSIEEAVYAFLDCGVFDRGFARVRCPECCAEFLVAFSCQRRGLCPSCAAKRGALFGAFLAEVVVEDVGHCLWTFTIPKMLRVFFLHHRELLGYRPKSGPPGGAERIFEVTEFLARLLQHVPEPRPHQVRYYGYYSNVARARRAEREDSRHVDVTTQPAATEPGAAERRRLRRSWALSVRRIYEVDPLTCAECGSRMRILAFLLAPAVVRKILDHLDKRPDRTRAPPAPAGVATAALP